MDKDILYLAEIFQDEDLSHLRDVLQRHANNDLNTAIEILLDPGHRTKPSASRQTSLSGFIVKPTKKSPHTSPIIIDDLSGDGPKSNTISDLKLSLDESSSETVENRKRALAFSEAFRSPKSSKNEKKRTSQKAIILHGPEKIPALLPTTTFHSKFLPSDQALKLLEEVLDSSRAWYHNRFFLFDREVESPHLTSSYCSSIEGNFPTGEYFYNGQPSLPYEPFTSTMEAVASKVQDFINQERLKRTRYELYLTRSLIFGDSFLPFSCSFVLCHFGVLNPSF